MKAQDKRKGQAPRETRHPTSHTRFAKPPARYSSLMISSTYPKKKLNTFIQFRTKRRAIQTFNLASGVVCVTILRDTVTTSWSADDICFSYIKYILLVRHLGFVCVLLYIARSGLLHGGSGGIEKLVSDYCCRHFYSGPVNEKKKKHGTAYSFISTTYCSADRYTV